MALAFRCERCGKDFKVGDECAGRRGKCKQCGHVFVIPSGRSADESPRAPSPRPAGEGSGPRAKRSSPAQAAARSFARDVDPYGFDEAPSGKPVKPTGSPASISDPYGFDDDDLPRKPLPRREPDLDEPLPPRPKPLKKRKKERAASRPGDSPDFPYWAILLAAIFGFVMARKLWLRSPAAPDLLLIGLVFSAYTSILSGALAGLVIAFREGLKYAICFLFIPFFAFFYYFSRWESTKQAFCLLALGWILFGVLGAMAPSLRGDLEHGPRPEVAGAPAFGLPVPSLPPGATLVPAPPDPPRVILADFTDQALADLKSSSRRFQDQALDRLKEAQPKDRRAEIAKAVEPMLTDSDGFRRDRAAQVLGIWGGPENMPVLLNGLKDPSFSVRWTVLDALKVRRDPTTADAIVDCLLSFDHRGKTVETLKAIGPAAEDSVLRGLNHHNKFTRIDVCRVLAQIGTSKSISPLQSLVDRSQGQGLESMAANEAMKQIASRDPNAMPSSANNSADRPPRRGL